MSEEKNTLAAEPVEHTEGDMKKRYKDKLDKKDSEIEKLQKEVEHWKNEYYLAFADMQNLRKNLERDHRDILRYRAEGFVEKLLPVIDSFNMALQTKPEDSALKNYLTGFEFIYKNFLKAIESEGAKEIHPNIGDPFDSATMHAVDTQETEGESNLITQVYSVGLMLHDRIIRPAMVTVSKKPSAKEESKETEETKATKASEIADA